MPKGFTFGPRRELGETLNLDFLASRPPPGPRPERAPPAPAAAEQDRPLHLDLAEREPPYGRPGTVYHGFAGDPAAAYLSRGQRPERGSRSGRWLLALGLAAVAALSVAAAFISYPAVERRIMTARTAPAEPAPAAQIAEAPAQAAAQPVEVQQAKVPAPLDAAPLTPALARAPVAEPAPKAPQPKTVKAEAGEARPQARAEARRPRRRGPGPEASVETARANIDEAYAPQSTLSAQMAGQGPSD
jgi:hypothetical protein